MKADPNTGRTPRPDAGPLHTEVELTWLEGRIEHWIRFGHDSGETILRPGGPSGSLIVLNAPAPEDGPYMVFPPVASLSPRHDAHTADPPSLPITDHRRRRAWLQCLLF